MKIGDKRNNWMRGYSLVELIVVIALLGFLGTTAALVISHRPSDARNQKLTSDVKALNRAIQSYLVFGGSLEDAATPADVIAKLKSKADEISSKQIAGLTGSYIDPRLTVRMQGVPVDGEARAVWNTDTQRFELATSGPAGVAGFELGAVPADGEITPETRDAGMKMAVTDPWIWDFDELDAVASIGPTGVATTEGSGGTGGPGGGAGAPPPPVKVPLAIPSFSVPAGKYIITDYPLTLFLLNPNPARYSRLMYQVSGGSWIEYAPGTPLRVDPDTYVSAYAQTLDNSLYTTSQTRRYRFQVLPIRLDAPVIYPTATRLDYVTMPSVLVQIVDSNHASLSRIEYRINTGPWADYTGPITLNAVDYPLGAKVRARAMPIVAHYNKSSTADQLISRPTPLFNGSGDGWFSNPHGPPGMVTNIGPGDTDDYFRWGVSALSGRPPSNMTFTGKNFSEMEPGVRFQLGTLDYYNGSIYADGIADTVELNVEMEFDSGHTHTWDFILELINTPNADRTPEEAADIVHLASLASSASTTINGDEFYLILEFGETSEMGFSSLDQFHVIEDESASGALYATLIAAEDLDDIDPIYFGDGDVDYWDMDPGPESVLAPLLLGLDSTVFDTDISSIEEIAEEHRAKSSHYQTLSDEYQDLADLAMDDGDPVAAAEYQALSDENQDLADKHDNIDAWWLLSEDLYDADRKDIFEDWVDDGRPHGVKVDNPWMRWSTEFAGDEVLLPGGTIYNHGWWTLPEDKPWAGEKFATGDVALHKLDKVRNSNFLDGEGLSMLLGRTVVAVVYEKDIYKYGPGLKFTDLSRGRLGRIAFTVTGVELPGGLDESTADGSLWDLRVRIESPLEPSVYDLDPWTRDLFIDPDTGEETGGTTADISV